MAHKKATTAEIIQYANAGFVHHPYYCEEHIWHLTQHEALKSLPSWVLLISNPARSVAMAHMRICDDPLSLLFWDYHVIWLGCVEQQWQVIDLDSKLPCPTALPIYLEMSFPSTVDALYQPQFRLLESAFYADHFSSDRRHMRDQAECYLAAPPPWPAIYNGKQHLLQAWLDFEDPAAPGVVLDLPALVAWVQNQV